MGVDFLPGDGRMARRDSRVFSPGEEIGGTAPGAAPTQAWWLVGHDPVPRCGLVCRGCRYEANEKSGPLSID